MKCKPFSMTFVEELVGEDRKKAIDIRKSPYVNLEDALRPSLNERSETGESPNAEHGGKVINKEIPQ